MDPTCHDINIPDSTWYTDTICTSGRYFYDTYEQCSSIVHCVNQSLLCSPAEDQGPRSCCYEESDRLSVTVSNLGVCNNCYNYNNNKNDKNHSYKLQWLSKVDGVQKAVIWIGWNGQLLAAVMLIQKHNNSLFKTLQNLTFYK